MVAYQPTVPGNLIMTVDIENQIADRLLDGFNIETISTTLYAGSFTEGHTRLLSGFNEQQVRDKDKLASLVGSFNLIMGMVMVGGAFIKHPDAQALIPILVIGYVILIAYVNTKMVD